MPHCPKITRRIMSILLAVALLCYGLFAMNEDRFGSMLNVKASTLDEIIKAEVEKQRTQENLENKQGEIENWKDQKGKVQGVLYELNRDLGEISENLSAIEALIQNKETEIDTTQEELEQAKQTEAMQYESMKKRIRFMYESGVTTYGEALLDSEGFGEVINHLDYIEALEEYDRNMLDEYSANIKSIEEMEKQLIEEKLLLDELKAEVERQHENLTKKIKETSELAAAYAGQLSQAEKQALEYEEQIRQAESDIQELKKKYEEELRLSKLAANSVKRDISEVVFAEGDLELLAAIIYCEAGNQPYEGQLAVGAVVINRVLSSVFPSTITEVIYQNKQFSPVGSGRFAIALAEKRATPACYRAAEEAMRGVTNVGGCVFFRTPIEGLEGIRIGGHIFY